MVMTGDHEKILKKGFVAIDIDGTVLIEKADKHIRYGFLNTQSHLRQSLIEYIRMAQKQGYDIIILTARPSIIDYGIEKLNIGTKPANEIVNIFFNHGIEPISIYRSGFSLKGKKLVERLESYHEGAVGILFDDRLSHVEDVRGLHNHRLHAYDINSSQDLIACFKSHIILREGLKNPFHPYNILNQVLEPIDDTKYTPASKSLRELDSTLKSIKVNSKNDILKSQVSIIIHDLSLRLYESLNKGYEPEIQFVQSAASEINSLLHLALDGALEHKHIEKVCYSLLGKTSPGEVQPNTVTEKHIKYCLVTLSIAPLLNQLVNQLIDYKVYLQVALTQRKETNYVFSNSLLSKQLAEVHRLIRTLRAMES